MERVCRLFHEVRSDDLLNLPARSGLVGRHKCHRRGARTNPRRGPDNFPTTESTRSVRYPEKLGALVVSQGLEGGGCRAHHTKICATRGTDTGLFGLACNSITGGPPQCYRENVRRETEPRDPATLASEKYKRKQQQTLQLFRSTACNVAGQRLSQF